ncbi:MAG: hypothetical protein ACU0A6_17150 [Shimia sp.]|jgi:hypothetical protein|uniref:hypothetical protein n=1 Tax=Shimia sp. TaxID=1954381 RepID=UPI004059F620
MKNMMMSLAVVCFGSVALGSSNALKNPVNSLSEPGQFEVVNKWTPKSDYFWCSAARAALERGAARRDRLYVSMAMGPSRTAPGEQAVAFTFRPDASLVAQGANGSDLNRVGSNMSVSQGERRCVRELDG